MRDPNKPEPLPISPSEVCQRAFGLIRGEQWEDAEKLLAHMLTKSEDDATRAVYHSTLGVLYKQKGEPRVAWKHYQRAEKLLPEDPALKLISARLLIEQFAEADPAIRKAKKVLDLVPKNPVFVHQAHVVMGLAYVKKGDRVRAVSALAEAMANGFDPFITAANIDLTLVEALARHGWGLEERRHYLENALAFAQTKREAGYVKLFQQLLKAL